MFDLGARFEWLHLPPEVSRALDLPAVRARAAAARCARCDWLCAAAERACRNCGLPLSPGAEPAPSERVPLAPPALELEPAGALALADAPLADPAALLDLVELESLRAAPPPDRLATLADFPLAPFEHQARAARRVLAEMPAGALLADAAGLGKTVEAALILRELRARGECARALIVCAPGAARRWQDELALHAGERLEELTRPDGARAHDVLLVTHARLARAPLRAALAETPWDLLVVDDAHLLGDPDGARHASVRALPRRRALLLSADPARDGLESLRALCDLIRPGALGTARAFRRAQVRRDDPRAPRDRADLREALAALTLRADRLDAAASLPPRALARCRFALAPAERALADALARWAGTARHRAEQSPPLRALLAEMEARARSSSAALATAANDAAGRTSLPVAWREGAAEIARAARAITAESRALALLEVRRARPEPIAVFTRFPETAHALARALADAGVPVASATTAAEVSRALSRGGAVLCTDGIDVDLAGVPLAVHYDLPARHAELDRRTARVHRLGARDAITEVFLCADGTADELVLRALSGDGEDDTGAGRGGENALDRMLLAFEREAALARRIARGWLAPGPDGATAHSVEARGEGLALPVGVHAGVRTAREGAG